MYELNYNKLERIKQILNQTETIELFKTKYNIVFEKSDTFYDKILKCQKYKDSGIGFEGFQNFCEKMFPYSYEFADLLCLGLDDFKQVILEMN